MMPYVSVEVNALLKRSAVLTRSPWADSLLWASFLTSARAWSAGPGLVLLFSSSVAATQAWKEHPKSRCSLHLTGSEPVVTCLVMHYIVTRAPHMKQVCSA